MRGKWKTKNGIIDIKDMSRSHIESCIEMLLNINIKGIDSVEKVSEFDSEISRRDRVEENIKKGEL